MRSFGKCARFPEYRTLVKYEFLIAELQASALEMPVEIIVSYKARNHCTIQHFFNCRKDAIFDQLRESNDEFVCMCDKVNRQHGVEFHQPDRNPLSHLILRFFNDRTGYPHCDASELGDLRLVINPIAIKTSPIRSRFDCDAAMRIATVRDVMCPATTVRSILEARVVGEIRQRANGGRNTVSPGEFGRPPQSNRDSSTRRRQCQYRPI